MVIGLSSHATAATAYWLKGCHGRSFTEAKTISGLNMHCMSGITVSETTFWTSSAVLCLRISTKKLRWVKLSFPRKNSGSSVNCRPVFSSGNFPPIHYGNVSNILRREVSYTAPTELQPFWIIYLRHFVAIPTPLHISEGGLFLYLNCSWEAIQLDLYEVKGWQAVSDQSRKAMLHQTSTKALPESKPSSSRRSWTPSGRFQWPPQVRWTGRVIIITSGVFMGNRKTPERAFGTLRVRL